MKRVLLMALVALGGLPLRSWSAANSAASAQGTLPLAEARGRIDAVVNAGSGSEMAAVMARLTAADQRRFLADVNKAVGELPGSLEEKTAKYLNLNHAAVKVAKKGNAMALLAEVFATVPPESLTVISERFASDLLNRAADPAVTYSDAQFTNIAVRVMQVVNERLAETDDASVRSAFAVIMLVRASNGTPADLADRLVDTLADKGARELARSEWIPEALGKAGREANYEPILASADAGRRPDLDFVLVIAGPQHLDAVLADLVGRNTDSLAGMSARTPVLDAVQSTLISQIPTLDDSAANDPRTPRPKDPQPGHSMPPMPPVPPTPPEPPVPPEPGPY
ncbi:MAG: hypothetical protein ACI4RD_06190 [Kiritimatiellia bacterium]